MHHVTSASDRLAGQPHSLVCGPTCPAFVLQPCLMDRCKKLAITAQYRVCGCRPVSAAAEMTAVAESSATEETASDASYSADELPEEHATAALHRNRGSMPSSKEWHCMSHRILVMPVNRLDCCLRHVCCHSHVA